MSNPDFTKYSTVKTSLNGYNGGRAGQRCITPDELLEGWLAMCRRRGNLEAIATAKKNWSDFSLYAKELVKRHGHTKGWRPGGRNQALAFQDSHYRSLFEE